MSIKKTTLAYYLIFSFLVGIFVDKADPKVATWTVATLIALLLLKAMYSIFKLKSE